MHRVAVTLFVVFVGRLAAATLDDGGYLFFKFGNEAHDTTLPKGVDGFSDAIVISASNFVFSGQQFSSLYVSYIIRTGRSFGILLGAKSLSNSAFEFLHGVV